MNNLSIRYFSVAALTHVMVLLLLIPTLKGWDKSLRGDINFLGAILRAPEVVPSGAGPSTNRPTATMPGIVYRSTLNVPATGITSDKPSLVVPSGYVDDSDLTRFTGQPVELDQDESESSQPLTPLRMNERMNRP